MKVSHGLLCFAHYKRNTTEKEDLGENPGKAITNNFIVTFHI